MVFNWLIKFTFFLLPINKLSNNRNFRFFDFRNSWFFAVDQRTVQLFWFLLVKQTKFSITLLLLYKICDFFYARPIKFTILWNQIDKTQQIDPPKWSYLPPSNKLTKLVLFPLQYLKFFCITTKFMIFFHTQQSFRFMCISYTQFVIF